MPAAVDVEPDRRRCLRPAEKARPGRGHEEGEEIEAENAKDGVSLDELFQLKPEIFAIHRRGRGCRREEEGQEEEEGR